MNKDKLGLEDESIIEEIKEVYGERFNEISEEDLNNLIYIIRDKRFYEYEVEFNKIHEEYKRKSKPAFIFGTLFIALTLVMIVFNILYRTDVIVLSNALAITIDCVLGVGILVFLVYYITFFKRFKNFVLEDYKKNNSIEE